MANNVPLYLTCNCAKFGCNITEGQIVDGQLFLLRSNTYDKSLQSEQLEQYLATPDM